MNQLSYIGLLLLFFINPFYGMKVEEFAITTCDNEEIMLDSQLVAQSETLKCLLLFNERPREEHSKSTKHLSKLAIDTENPKTRLEADKYSLDVLTKAIPILVDMKKDELNKITFLEKEFTSFRDFRKLMEAVDYLNMPSALKLLPKTFIHKVLSNKDFRKKCIKELSTSREDEGSSAALTRKILLPTITSSIGKEAIINTANLTEISDVIELAQIAEHIDLQWLKSLCKTLHSLIQPQPLPLSIGVPSEGITFDLAISKNTEDYTKPFFNTLALHLPILSTSPTCLSPENCSHYITKSNEIMTEQLKTLNTLRRMEIQANAACSYENTIGYYFGYQWFIVNDSGDITSLKINAPDVTDLHTRAMIERLAKPSPVEIPALDFKISMQFCDKGNYLIALLSKSTFYAKGYLIIWEKNIHGEWNINSSFSQEVDNDTIDFAVSNESIIALSTPSTISFFDVCKKSFMGHVKLPHKGQNIISISDDDAELAVLYPTEDSESLSLSSERGYIYPLHNDHLKDLIMRLSIPEIRLLGHIACHESFPICENHCPESVEVLREALAEATSLEELNREFNNKLKFKSCWKCRVKRCCCL